MRNMFVYIVLNPTLISISQNINADLKEPKVKWLKQGATSSLYRSKMSNFVTFLRLNKIVYTLPGLKI